MLEGILNGRYEIKEKVGSGGMAEVYRGVDLTDDKVVAIKVLKQEYSNDPQYLRRLEREAEAMVSLKNENIVSFYGMGNEGDIHYLVLEFVNGRTLRDYMDEVGKLRPREAVTIVCKVLNGLSHAHKMGLIHRDVKPQNIMLTDDGGIKLADFGIAKFTGSITQTYEGKEAMGSVYYISPEQAQGETVDAQADIYSCGVMLYEMLTGQTPFSGDNAVQVALKHVKDEIPPVREIDESISPALGDVIARATAKDRSVRYSTAVEMRNDLRKALRYPLSRFARIRKSETAETPSQPEEKKSFIKEHLPLIAVIGSVLGVIAVFTIMFLISMSNGEADYSKVPNILGYTESAAMKYAQNRGFTIIISGREPSDDYSAGEICMQDPEPQTKVKNDRIIRVTVSTGNETVSVPRLYGLTLEEAREELKAAGLVLDKQIDYVADTQPVGTVIAQSVNPGETVMAGDVVRITVCSESAMTVKMPDLIGKNVYEAAELLADSGVTSYRIIAESLNEIDSTHEDYEVVEQEPAEGTDILYDRVTALLYINKDNAKKYKAEFSENVNLSADKNDIVITVVSPAGEVILFREIYEGGSHSIPFTGYYWESGSFTCVLYVNGEIYTSFIKNFS